MSPSSSSSLTADLTPTARDSISALLAILDAFNYRNKNQHRSSHWWSHFNILRRSLRVLLHDAITVCLLHVDWLRDHVIPRSYVSFTQLAADNQHAPLGLMLLVVLAKVKSILNQIHPVDDSQHFQTSQRLPAEARGDVTTIKQDDGDRGIAVTRSGMELSEKNPDPTAEARPKRRKKKRGHRDELSSLFDTLA